MQEALCAACLGAIDPAELTFRAMFGGRMAYAEGRPFASLSNVGLALKLAPDDQAPLLAIPGAERLRYEPDAPASKSYLVVPAAWVDSPDSLAPWATKSVQFVRTQPLKKKARGS